MLFQLVNVYNPTEILTASITPINGAHIPKRGTVEMHRGNRVTLDAYVSNLIERGMYRMV